MEARMAYGEYIPWNHGKLIETPGEEVAQAWFYVTRMLDEARDARNVGDEALYRFEAARFRAALGGTGLTALIVERTEAA
jgi:hypothetical protein